MRAGFWRLPARHSYSVFLIHLLFLRALLTAIEAAGAPPSQLLYKLGQFRSPLGSDVWTVFCYCR